MKKTFKVVSTASLGALFASSALIPVASADASKVVENEIEEIIVEKDGKNVALNLKTYSDFFREDVNLGTITYVVSNAGETYSLKKYSDYFRESENSAETFEKLQAANESEELEVVKGKVEDGELVVDDETTDEDVVNSVSAINQTVNKAAGEIKFNVNGKAYTLAEFEEAFEGYTVEFLTNNSNITITDGKVTTDVKSFKYAVKISKDGEAINNPVAADFAEVTTVDATEATIVHKLGLIDESKDAWENPTVTKDDKVTIVATEFENALGDKNTDVDEDGDATAEATALVAPTVDKVVSSDPTVAYYEDGVIVRNKDGKVTFTVTFKGKAFEGKKYTLDVNVKAKQTQTSIEAKDLKVKADDAQTLDITVLDQDGEEMRNAEGQTVFITSTLAGKKEAAKATKLAGKVAFEAGQHTVNVYDDADKTTKLGSFKVEAVDVGTDIEEYKLVVSEDSKDDKGNVKPLDLNTDEDVNNETLKLDVEAFIEDIKVDLDATELIAKSSNEKVATVTDTNEETVDNGVVTVEAKTVGKTTITLYTVEGQMNTPVATYEVEVTNSTKPVETLTLKNNTKVIVKGEEGEDLAAAVQAAVKEEKIEDKIATVETVEASNIVIVTMEEEYGGKEFVLDAIFGVAELSKAEYVAAVEGSDKGEDTEAVAAKATIGGVDFEAVDAGVAGNDLKVVIEQGVATAEDTNVNSSVAFANDTLTITIGAVWDESANEDEGESAASTLTVEELKTLIEADDDAKAAIKVTTETADTEVGTASETSLEGGVDFEAGTPAVPAEAATLTFTFSEAVALDGDFSFTIGEGEEAATIAGDDIVDVDVDVEDTEVVVTLADDVEVSADDTITAITGLKAVKGIVILPEEAVEVTTTP